MEISHFFTAPSFGFVYTQNLMNVSTDLHITPWPFTELDFSHHIFREFMFKFVIF